MFGTLTGSATGLGAQRGQAGFPQHGQHVSSFLSIYDFPQQFTGHPVQVNIKVRMQKIEDDLGENLPGS